MPFNIQGEYTPVANATVAAPGNIIASADWNSIHSDLSAALTLLGQQVYGGEPVALLDSPYTVLPADAMLLVDTTGGPITINLPSASSRNHYPLRIKDATGTASTHNITIVPDGTDTIEGLTTYVISQNYGSVGLVPVSSTWLIVPKPPDPPVPPDLTPYMLLAGHQTTTGGFCFTSYNIGVIASGTVTPDAMNGNYQYYDNNGAHTLAAPTVDCSIDLLMTNDASAGTVTFTGFTVGFVGDTLTTINGNKFIISLRCINSVATYVIKALQ